MSSKNKNQNKAKNKDNIAKKKTPTLLQSDKPQQKTTVTPVSQEMNRTSRSIVTPKESVYTSRPHYNKYYEKPDKKVITVRKADREEKEPTDKEKINPKVVHTKKNDLSKSCLYIDQIPWLKLLYVSRMKSVEVGGFCVTSTDDPLHVTELHMVKAICSQGHIRFFDESLSEFISKKTQEGLAPAQCSRIWWHKHPGASATPSSEDWHYFDEHFAQMDWHIMLIRANEGDITCNLRLKTSGVHEEEEDFETGAIICGEQKQRPIWVDVPMNVYVNPHENYKVALNYDQVHPKLLKELPFEEWAKEHEECCHEPEPVQTSYPRSSAYYSHKRQRSSAYDDYLFSPRNPLNRSKRQKDGEEISSSQYESLLINGHEYDNEEDVYDDQLEIDIDGITGHHPGRVWLDATKGEFYDTENINWFIIAFVDPTEWTIDWKTIAERYSLNNESLNILQNLDNRYEIEAQLKEYEVLLQFDYESLYGEDQSIVMDVSELIYYEHETDDEDIDNQYESDDEKAFHDPEFEYDNKKRPQ